jgi:predicted nucleic acid-binding protein
VRVLFDTSAIVPALVDQLPNHEAAFHALSEYTDAPNEAVCSTHCLAECYAVLTALPLARRITPAEAQQLIADSVAGHMTVCGLTGASYLEAIALVAQRGLMSGAVYDALHIAVAVESHSDRIVTYNLRHFRSLAPESITVVTP